jgi:hypothetical protein
VLVSADGRVVDSVTPLSKGIIEARINQAQDRPVAVSLTQVEPDYPLETHVFASLQANIPVYVMTSDSALWLVEGDRIALVMKPDPANAPAH